MSAAQDPKIANHIKLVTQAADLPQIDSFIDGWVSSLVEAKLKYKLPEDTPVGAVIYTDGGCRPSRGIGGWGIHGYLYAAGEPKQGHGCKEAVTDVGYLNKQDPSAIKVSVLRYVDGSGSLIPESTNNEAELEALYQALCVADRCNVTKLHLILDSEYVLKGATERLDGWILSNWVRGDGQPVANVGHWSKIHGKLTALKDKNTHLTWEWVKGHGDSTGNILADSNATRGIIAGRKGFHIVDLRLSDTKLYWKPEVDKHPFISEPRWYFRTNVGTSYMTDSGHWTYHLGKAVEIEHVGKKIADTNYAVVQLSRPVDVLERVRDFQHAIEPSLFNGVVEARLDNLFNPRVFCDIHENETTYLQRIGPKVDIFTHEETPLTNELRPPRLAFKAIDEFVALENLLNDIRLDKQNGYQLSEITDLLYESVAVKKKTERKLKLELDATDITVDVNYDVGGGVKTAPVTLTLGIDIPRRNTLSAIADTDARVFVVTWKESNIAFRYATIIRMGDDLGIWAGVYANIRLLAS